MNHLNMHETFRRWPLGTTSLGAWKDLYGPFFHEWHGSPLPFDDWLYERLRPLLEAPAYQEFFGDDAEWVGWPKDHYKSPHTVGGALLDCIEHHAQHENKRGYAAMRVILPNSTIIREWGAS